MNLIKKRAQMNLSFGMIFSLILIIVFLGFGFYAVKKFIDMQNNVQVKMFMEDLQNDVTGMWKSTGGNSQIVNYSLPTKITFVCFQDDEFENLKFVSKDIIHGKIIEHLNIESILSGEDEVCIPNLKGKVSFKIAKDYGETLVTIIK